MTRSAIPDMPADHRRLVRDILRAHLPHGVRVWVFGSRATGRARRHSDLDLALDCGRRLTLDERARLAEAFSDSDLPYRIDILDWQGLDDRFRRIIAAERVLLADTANPEAAAVDPE